MNQEIKKIRKGITIIFFKEKEDIKFSWKIENDPRLTELLLKNSKSKKVKFPAIRFVADGIFEKISNIHNLKSTSKH